MERAKSRAARSSTPNLGPQQVCFAVVDGRVETREACASVVVVAKDGPPTCTMTAEGSPFAARADEVQAYAARGWDGMTHEATAAAGTLLRPGPYPVSLSSPTLPPVTTCTQGSGKSSSMPNSRAAKTTALLPSMATPCSR